MFAQHWNAPLGIGFLVALILALWAVFNIAQNERTPPLFKATWIVFVLFIPYLGFIIWFLFGPRTRQ